MRRAVLSRVFGVALILAAVAVSGANKAAPPTVKLLTVGGVAVSMPWDAAWIADEHAGADHDSVSFNSSNKLHMSTFLSLGTIPEDTTPEAFSTWVMDKTTKDLLKQSAEKEIQVKSFGAVDTKGARACATDRAPKPDEYKYICQGVVMHERHALIFTVLYNDAGKAAADKAVAAIEALQFPQGT